MYLSRYIQQLVIYFVSIFLIIETSPAFSIHCHPIINPHLTQYVIGYGSLMDEKSKKRTDPNAMESLPVVVKGYSRRWALHGDAPGVNATFLSVVPNQHASFNGIIYALSHPSHVQYYDKRESNYCRKELSPDKLSMYSAILPAKKQIWIYYSTSHTSQAPSIDYPIVQSYVDIFMRGCIQVEKKYNIHDFAKDCIRSTTGWSHHWVNDRIYPRRAFIYEPFASKIDQLIKELLPDIFKRITIE